MQEPLPARLSLRILGPEGENVRSVAHVGAGPSEFELSTCELRCARRSPSAGRIARVTFRDRLKVVRR
jgi:hypothetical protein